MLNSDQIQKKLNDLLAGKEDEAEEDIFLFGEEDNGKELVPQPKTGERIIGPGDREPEPPPLYERMASEFPGSKAEGEPEREAREKSRAEEREQEEKISTEGVARTTPNEEEGELSEVDKARDFVANGLGFLNENQSELNEKIKAMEIARKEDGIKMQAMAMGLGYINLKGLPIMPEVLKLIDEETAKEVMAVCFLYKKGEEIRVAVTAMTEAVENLARQLQEDHSGARVSIYLTSEESLRAVLKLYSSLPRHVEKVNDVQVLEKEIADSSLAIKDIREIQGRVNQASTTEILGILVMAAARIEASDIHIEAEETSIKVRFRVDGVLHDVATLPKDAWAGLIARIKLNAGLKINIIDRPQDGNFTLKVSDKPVDFRVSVLPTNYGESVVIRLLFHEKIRKMSLDNLGIDDYNKEILLKEISKPNGLLIITGPTGSGKTTTLYSILNKLNTADNKIITVEDPIEYKLEGINQSEVHDDKGYTFAKALRSIVRQDPDIILVGEIRDQETVEIVLNAALTGHLVLSTIHANSAAGVVARFMALGARPYLLSPALNVSVSQRLVRRICEFCKEPVDLDEEQKERVNQEISKLPPVKQGSWGQMVFYKGRGCEKCSGLGYKGQIGVFEILRVSEPLKAKILAGEVSEQEIKNLAVAEGMVSLAQDGILKALKGVTTIGEVFRVA